MKISRKDSHLFIFTQSTLVPHPFLLKTIAWNVADKRMLSSELELSHLKTAGRKSLLRGTEFPSEASEGFVKCMWRGLCVAMVICVYFYPPHPLCSVTLIQHTVMVDRRKPIMCCDFELKRASWFVVKARYYHYGCSAELKWLRIIHQSWEWVLPVLPRDYGLH